MDFVFWIILIVVIVGVVWWLLNRNSASKASGTPGTEGTRADGALSGGSAAASAEAAGTTGLPGAAGFGRPAEPAAPTTAEEPADTAAAPASPAVSSQDERRRQDEDEWETKWSEASGASAIAAGGAPHRGPQVTTGQESTGREGSRQEGAGREGSGQDTSPAPAEQSVAAAPASMPVHHPEYTGPHAPTLPGAETAAVEDTDDDGPSGRASASAGAVTGSGAESGMASGTAPAADAVGHPAPGNAAATPPAAVVPDSAPAAETADRTQSSALTEAGADHAQQTVAAATPEPAGHLAADEPYGAGSAAAGADGSGPDGYTVKGDAGTMVYYEEGHPEYEQARAEVWFESAAHAEAAGFRVPRRKRLQ